MKKFLLITLLSLLFIKCSNNDDNTDTDKSTLFDQILIHYPFDGNVKDISVNNYHGTNYGATFTNDRFGNTNSAMLFDGINDYVDLPNLIDLKPNTSVSFSFWVRYDSSNINDRDVFNTSFEEDKNSGIYFNSQASTGNYAINFGDGSSNYSSTSRRTYVANKSIEINVWHHIVVVVNSRLDMRIYVDSIETTGTYSGSGNVLQYSNTSGCIGRHDRSIIDPANYFKGALDDFRYWNKELTENEISELYR